MIPTHYEGAYFEVYMCKIICPYDSFFQFIFAPQKPFKDSLVIDNMAGRGRGDAAVVLNYTRKLIEYFLL